MSTQSSTLTRLKERLGMAKEKTPPPPSPPPPSPASPSPVALQEPDQPSAPQAASAPESVASRLAAVNWERLVLVEPTPEAASPQPESVANRLAAVNWSRDASSPVLSTGASSGSTNQQSVTSSQSVDSFFSNVNW